MSTNENEHHSPVITQTSHIVREGGSHENSYEAHPTVVHSTNKYVDHTTTTHLSPHRIEPKITRRSYIQPIQEHSVTTH